MKKILIFIFLFFLSFSVSFANSCKYQWKIDKCNSALSTFLWWKDLKFISNAWSLKDFTDFPCLQAPFEDRVFQIILDEKFSEIDKEMDEYLKNLYDNKTFYFWKWKSFDFFDWLAHIFSKKDEFKKRYEDTCKIIIEESFACVKTFLGEKKIWAVSNSAPTDFLTWTKSDCNQLAKLKSDIFLDISYNWLILNLSQVFADEVKKFSQKQRENYNDLLDEIRINLSFIERLLFKWNEKTKHTF